VRNEAWRTFGNLQNLDNRIAREVPVFNREPNFDIASIAVEYPIKLANTSTGGELYKPPLVQASEYPS
jgi:hypothetical protein